jgi:hypothetical protein
MQHTTTFKLDHLAAAEGIDAAAVLLDGQQWLIREGSADADLLEIMRDAANRLSKLDSQRYPDYRISVGTDDAKNRKTVLALYDEDDPRLISVCAFDTGHKVAKSLRRRAQRCGPKRKKNAAPSNPEHP